MFDPNFIRQYPAGEHSFTFNGLVEGYQEPDDDYPFTSIQRLVPNGDYRLVLYAESGNKQVQIEIPIEIIDSVVNLPEITKFEVDPPTITPNEDGIDDAAKIIIDLAHDVELLSLYADAPDGNSYPIPELEGESIPNSAGMHIFHFDALDIAGEQLGNGTHIIRADVFDQFGQHINWEVPLDVQETGELFGYIADGKVSYSASTIALQESFCFHLRVRNDGDAFLRTTGPWSGETYGVSESFVSKQYPEDKGVYRVGLDFDSRESLYPFRWGLGTPGVDLVKVNGSWYLPPNSEGVVSGCIEFDQLPEINPQYAWVGLLHEQSAEPLVNHRVAPHLFNVTTAGETD